MRPSTSEETAAEKEVSIRVERNRPEAENILMKKTEGHG